jgi:hypothetical protein
MGFKACCIRYRLASVPWNGLDRLTRHQSKLPVGGAPKGLYLGDHRPYPQIGHWMAFEFVPD